MKNSNRIGIYGGSFDPIHSGHIQGMVESARRFSLDKVYAIPAFQNPLKERIEGPTPDQRVEMVRMAIEGYEDTVELDTREIERGGKSFTIETLREFAEDHDRENIYLILGMDAFDRFDEWKQFDEILQLCNIIVTSRPGVPRPRDVNDLPKGLHQHIEIYDSEYVALKSGTSIQFLSIQDVEISSTELRKRLRSGRSVKAYLPIKVEQYLQENNIYEPIGDKIGDPIEFLRSVCSMLDTRRAIAVRAYDLNGLNAPSDYAVVASGTSQRHAKSIGEYVYQDIKDEFGVMPLSLEGTDEGRWVLIDYGAIIVHVFYDFVRADYNLEELWKSGKEITETVS